MGQGVHQYAAGIRHLLVNGELVLREGEATHRRAGRLLGT